MQYLTAFLQGDTWKTRKSWFLIPLRICVLVESGTHFQKTESRHRKLMCKLQYETMSFRNIAYPSRVSTTFRGTSRGPPWHKIENLGVENENWIPYNVFEGRHWRNTVGTRGRHLSKLYYLYSEIDVFENQRVDIASCSVKHSTTEGVATMLLLP